MGWGWGKRRKCELALYKLPAEKENVARCEMSPAISPSVKTDDQERCNLKLQWSIECVFLFE